SIGEGAFGRCQKLENINLPAKLSTIGDFAFASSGLKTLTVNWTTPLSIQANVFNNVDLSKCILYVPAGCKEAYKNANVWNKFGHILEIGETPDPEEEEEEVEPIEPITTGSQKIGDLWYNLHEDLTATLMSFKSNKDLTGAITVPASVTCGAYTYTVNEMQDDVFNECSKLTELTLPNTITEIPSRAFF
ncbi:MAG: leucine-rich repeat protein, partial [Paludibacteraceae bacterium]|nr:leucine-rich repeat protein [Paludibacteraceae bacterium]